MLEKSYIIDSLQNISSSTLQAKIVKKSEAEVIINKFCCYVQINSIAKLNFK